MTCCNFEVFFHIIYDMYISSIEIATINLYIYEDQLDCTVVVVVFTLKTVLTSIQYPYLTGPLFPIGIEHLIYMKFLCYGSSYGYYGHINIDSSAPDWPGTVQKHSDTSTKLKN